MSFQLCIILARGPDVSVCTLKTIGMQWTGEVTVSEWRALSRDLSPVSLSPVQFLRIII